MVLGLGLRRRPVIRILERYLHKLFAGQEKAAGEGFAMPAWDLTLLSSPFYADLNVVM